MPKLSPPRDIQHFERWVQESQQLSMTSLRNEIEKVGQVPDLMAALQWSMECNEGIHRYQSPDYKAFPGVQEGLAALASHGEVYVVSTANKDNISREWQANDLDQYVTDYRCQEAGPKKVTLASFLEAGARPEDVIMIGDSPGDLEAAETNGVCFYPILVGQEEASWEHLKHEALDLFLADNYPQHHYRQVFKNHLHY